MALESCAAPDRKANESLILRLKTHARNLCLFWQARWFDTAGGVRWAGGERVFVDRDIRQLLYGTGLRCESARVMRAEPGKAAMTAAI